MRLEFAPIYKRVWIDIVAYVWCSQVDWHTVSAQAVEDLFRNPSGLIADAFIAKRKLIPKLSDSCGRNVHLRIKEAFVLTLLVEWWTERRNCLGTTLFSALNAATWTRKAVLVHTPSVAMADQWVCY